MPGFDFVCPKSYPNKCDLYQGEVDRLLPPEGYQNGFLMYKFDQPDIYLKGVVQSFFNGGRNIKLLDASEQPGSGIKICKICSLVTASSFGIGVVSPENYNVFLEIGMMWGRESQYCLSPTRII
ncbi:MAG: hypothetical protein NTW14_13055 [bacterium]|nr:hypothetical protein [bacterium]